MRVCSGQVGGNIPGLPYTPCLPCTHCALCDKSLTGMAPHHSQSIPQVVKDWPWNFYYSDRQLCSVKSMVS